MAKYLIPEFNMNGLESKLHRIANKCKKYGCDFHFNKGAEVIKEVETPFGAKENVKFIEVEVFGKAVAESGWRFIATVEELNGGNVIRQADTSVEIPQRFFENPIVCEHCNINRYRKSACILYNESKDEWKEVGKSCLKDFTGDLDAEYVSLLASAIKYAEESSSDYSEFASGKRYFKVIDILCYAAEVIKHQGYVKSDSYEAEPTGKRTYRFYEAGELGRNFDHAEEQMKAVDFNAYSDENHQTVESAMEWILNKEEDEFDSYIHNLQVIVRSGYVSEREIGMLASLMQVYRKHIQSEELKKARMEAESGSEWLGSVGDKIKVDVKSAELVTSWETQWGFSGLFKFIDVNGNVIIWITGNADLNKVLTISGTIKKLDEYNGIKQTQLTRCKLTHNVG